MPDIKAEPEWAAFVAIDWADQKHYWKLKEAGSQQCQRGELAHTPEALESWAAELCTRFGGRPVAVCLEQSRGSLVYMLAKYSHLVLYPVHATTAARFRSAFYPSGSKSDPGDTDLLLELLIQHRGHLRRLDPDTAETRLLQLLVEQRRRWVDEKTACSNRLTAWLKLYFPQALALLDDIDSPLGCALLRRWPVLQQLQRAKPDTLRQFFTGHNCRSQQRIEERLDAIYKAVPTVQDEALLKAGPAIAVGMVDIWRRWRGGLQIWTSALKLSPTLMPSAAYLQVCRELARCYCHACWPPLEAIANASRQLTNWSPTAALPRSPNAAAARNGFISATVALNFYAKLSTSSLRIRYVNPLGRVPFINRKSTKANAITPRCARWPLNGSAFYFVAGKTGSRMTKQPTYARSNCITPPCPLAFSGFRSPAFPS
jgi:Transposase